MKRSKICIVMMTIAVASLFISTTAFVEPVSANYCTRNMDRIQEKLIKLVNSDTWKKGKAKIDAMLTSEQLQALDETVGTMLINEGVSPDDPMYPLLVEFIVGVYEIMALMIGHNIVTLMLTAALTSIFVLPAIIIADAFFGFLAGIPLILSAVLISFPNVLNLQEIILKFGLFGAAFYAIFILPLLVLVILGVFIVAFPLVAFPMMIMDFFDTYEAALWIITEG